jgi:hypothetical protein
VSLLTAPARLVGAGFGLPQRLLRLVTEAEELLAGARRSLASVEATIAAANAAVTRVDGVLDATETILARTRTVVGSAHAVTGDAATTVAAAGRLTGTGQDLLGQVEPSVQRVLPLLEKFADSVSPAEVDAAVALVNELPELTRSLQHDVLPLLQTLDRVGPDVNEMLHVLDDLRRAILGIPGFTFLKKRGADRIEEDEAHELHPRDPEMNEYMQGRPD